jgi:hypothetical protein
MKNECAFSLTEKVIVDGCDGIVAVVTAVLFRTTGCTVEISWMRDNRSNTAWIEEWRLSKWEE